MGVGVTHTSGSHSQREKVAVWPSFRLSGCSKQKVSTGRQGLDRCPRRHEQGRQAASARPRAPRPAVSAENLTTLWVSAVAICTLHLDFCQVRMVCHPWRAPHPTQCWLQGHSPGSKVPVTGRRSGGRGARCSRICGGSVGHGEPCAAGMFGGSSLQTRPTSLACVALSPVGGAPLERSPGISSLLCDLNGTRPFAMGHFLVVVVFTYGDFSTLMHRFLVFAA